MDVKDINLNEYEVDECLDNGNIVLRKKKSKFPTWEGLGNISGVFIGARSEFFEAPSDCTGCFLLSFAYCISCIGECNWNKRSDHKNVIFIEVKEENNG